MIQAMSIEPPTLPSFYKIIRYFPLYAPCVSAKHAHTISSSLNDDAFLQNMLAIFQITIDPVNSPYKPERQEKEISAETLLDLPQLIQILQTNSLPPRNYLNAILSLLRIGKIMEPSSKYISDYIKTKQNFLNLTNGQLNRFSAKRESILKITQYIQQFSLNFNYSEDFLPNLRRILFNILVSLHEIDLFYFDHIETILPILSTILYIIMPIPIGDRMYTVGKHHLPEYHVEAIGFWIMLKICFKSELSYIYSSADPFEGLKSFILLSNPYLYVKVKDQINSNLLKFVTSLFTNIEPPYELADFWLVGLSSRSFYEFILSTIAGCIIDSYSPDLDAAGMVEECLRKRGMKYVTSLGLVLNERARSLRGHE